MFGKMKQLYEMQKQAKELQRQLEAMQVQKTSSDGLIQVSVNGGQKVERIVIAPMLLAPEKKDLLEQTLRGVINEAFGEIQKQAAAQAAGLMKGFPGMPG